MLTLLPPQEVTPSMNPRPLMFEIKDKNQLYSFYMPFLRFGGLFIPMSNQQLVLPPGSKAMVLLTLLDDKTKKAVTGKVCWANPAGAPMGTVQGIGVAFDDNEANRNLKAQIENILVGILGKSETRTQTL